MVRPTQNNVTENERVPTSSSLEDACAHVHTTYHCEGSHVISRDNDGVGETIVGKVEREMKIGQIIQSINANQLDLHFGWDFSPIDAPAPWNVRIGNDGRIDKGFAIVKGPIQSFLLLLLTVSSLRMVLGVIEPLAIGIVFPDMHVMDDFELDIVHEFGHGGGGKGTTHICDARAFGTQFHIETGRARKIKGKFVHARMTTTNGTSLTMVSLLLLLMMECRGGGGGLVLLVAVERKGTSKGQG